MHMSERANGEGVEAYGGRVLMYLLAGHGTGPLTIEQLELAEYAGCKACAQASSGEVAQRISNVRHVIALVLRERRKTSERVETLVPVPTIAPRAAPGNGGGGRAARLERPVPVLPSGGVAVDIGF